MLLESTPYFYSAKVTVECDTPLSIKGDESDFTFDTTLVRDVNGYPTIPGTSIAGVLRSVAKQCGADEATLFGYADNKDVSPSQIQTSFGFVHTADNQPLLGLSKKAIESDNKVDLLLKNLTPILRDQVALNEYGAAVDGAKLDRTAVPKGARFSFELNWASGQQDDDQWRKILGWLAHPNFRIGGLTQRGFGKLKIIQINQAFYDMHKPEDLQAWQHNRQYDFNAQNGQIVEQTIAQADDFINFELDLKAEDFWRIGQGSKAIRKDSEDFKEPDLIPYTETIITWNGNQATERDQQVVIPAAGVKGALRHRTLFHFRKLNNDFSDGSKLPKEAIYQNIALKNLFGDIQLADKNDKAKAGNLIMDDIYLDKTPATQIMMHNKIDRFTGGTIDGALFSEQLLYGGGFKLSGQIQTQKGDKLIEQSKELLTAFKYALQDLAEGRLALGGGSTKGHGYFNAQAIDLAQLDQAIDKAQSQKQEASA